MIDQPALAGVVELALNHGTCLTRVAANAAQAIAVLQEWQPQLAVIDMDVGESELIDRLEQGRPRARRIPVIVLTRRGDLRTKLEAFERGVDDILTVPFAPEELVARAIVVMRRTYGEVGVLAPALKVGDLEIDILHRCVRVGAHELHLTSLEQNLLYLLAANGGRLLTRDEILDYLWGTDYAAESNVIDRHIRNLRAKLQNDWRRPRFIETVPGQGYRFVSVSTSSVGPAGRGAEVFTRDFRRIRAEVIAPAFKLARSSWVRRGFESALRNDESPPAITLELWLNPLAISSLSFVGHPETERVAAHRRFGGRADPAESTGEYRLNQISGDAVQGEIDEFLHRLISLQERPKRDRRRSPSLQ